MAIAIDAASCPNCGAENPGRFCAGCGQKRIHERDLSVAHACHYVIDELFHVDGKILGSLTLLFLRPGQLTLDFIEGRRARHVNPIRLFMVISAAYFLFVHIDIERARNRYHDAMKGAIATFAAKRHITLAEATGHLEERAALRGQTMNVYFEDVFDRAESKVALVYKGVVITSYLSCGVWLSLLMRKRKRYLAEHMVMALHVASFIMIVTPLVHWLGSLHAGPVVRWPIEATLSFGYPLLAGFRVYQEEKRLTIVLKGLVTLVLSVVFYMVSIAIVMLVTIMPAVVWLYQ